VAWRRKWWVVVPTLLLGTFSYWRASNEVGIYETNSVVSYVDSSSQSSVFGSIGGGVASFAPLQSADEKIQAQAALAGTPEVKAEAAALLGDRGRLIKTYQARPAGGQLIALVVSSPDPKVAQEAANAFAEAFVKVQNAKTAKSYSDKVQQLQRFVATTARRAGDLDAKVKDLDRQIAQLDARIAAAAPSSGPNGQQNSNDPTVAPELRAQRSTLSTDREQASSQKDSLSRSEEDARTKIDQLNVDAAVSADNTAKVLGGAALPQETISPRPRRNAATAAVFGLLLGIGLAIAREMFDDRIHSAQEVASVAEGVPLLGTLPVHRGRSGTDRLLPGLGPQSIEAEAYRSVRTNLAFASIDNQHQALLVTSAVSGEGKSLTAANLALSIGRAGSSVALVDLDLRRPTLATLFGVEDADGLSSVLLGKRTLDDVLIPIDGEKAWLLPSGPIPPNAGEVMGSPRVGAVIEALRARFDHVIIDASPVLPVADPLTAMQWADGALFVVRIEHSRRRQVRSGIRRIRRANRPIVGIVLNGNTSREEHYYYGMYSAEPNRAGLRRLSPRFLRRSYRDDQQATAEWEAVVADNDGATDGIKDVTPSPRAKERIRRD
jgi:capsular exopolysaccharide synthesis family protein